jgi:hypothetical protein
MLAMMRHDKLDHPNSEGHTWVTPAFNVGELISGTETQKHNLGNADFCQDTGKIR